MRTIVLLALAGLLSVSPASAEPVQARDPLDVPAPLTRLATSTQLTGLARVGNRLVAVGVRGLVITSDDGGEHWVQRPVPVSSDLLALNFPTAKRGWAVGHDGVVLHSEDGGDSWIKQYDGRMAATQLSVHFKKLADSGDANAQRLLGEMQLNYESGPEQALLDVWFEDERHGFVCGSFGTLLATSDGGKTWQSWIESIEYEGLLHLNAIRPAGGQLFLASEKGIVFKLDRTKRRFVPTYTGYAGSFFTLTAVGDTLLAGGLRGTVYRTTDAGVSWEKLNTGLLSAITGATTTATGRVLMVSQNGRLLISDDAGSRFRGVPVPRPTVLSAVLAVGPNASVVVGLTGVQQVKFK